MSKVTSFDRLLVAHSRRFLEAAEAHPASLQLLLRYGFSAEEQQRGHRLVRDCDRAFAEEAAGTAWNFLSPTPERRVAEARDWYRDRRRRWRQRCIRTAEAGGLASAARQLLLAISPAIWQQHRAELAENLRRARGSRPVDAPPPKDTVIVELAGWYERWKLLAQRVFRDRPDLMEPFGLVPGKASPRLRNKEARVRYGEGAAGRTTLPVIVQPLRSDAEEDAS